MSINIHQVTKQYGDQQAVNQISFEVSMVLANQPP
jgi:ABC-type uncharacterized transport system ATPase subunit